MPFDTCLGEKTYTNSQFILLVLLFLKHPMAEQQASENYLNVKMSKDSTIKISVLVKFANKPDHYITK